MAQLILITTIVLFFANVTFHAQFANAQCLSGCTCQSPTSIACVSSSVCPSDVDSFYVTMSLASSTKNCGTSFARSTFSSLVNLRTLRVQDLPDYVSIEDQAFAETKLTELTIKETSLRIISPAGLTGLSLLTTLDLSNNLLQSLPDTVFGGLAALEHLALNDNGLTALSNELFTGLSQLTTLDLSNNVIATLSPNCLKPLTSLRSLKLSHNLITTLANDFLSGVPITSLTIDNNRLASIPADAFRGSNLMGLMMEHNLLTEFPGAALRRLPAMIVALAMRNNQVDRITDARNLTLGNVALDNNPLALVEPGSFAGSSIDFALSLSGTQLTSLPADMTEVITAGARLVLDGLTGWECLCESLWLAQFLNGSKDSVSPSCIGSGKALGESVDDVKLVCSLTPHSTTSQSAPPTVSTVPVVDNFSGGSREAMTVGKMVVVLFAAWFSCLLFV